jgi:nucleoside-triphosphatase THEP1
MEIKTVELVEILPTKIWSEKDLMGTVHIKMQHQGMDAFDFIQIQYNYAYTSNAHQHQLTQEILKLLGANNDEGKSE